MHRLTRWYVKTAFAYLLAALLLGVALAAQGVWSDLPPLPGLASVYVHLFLLGWVTQLVFGVAYWLFPRVAGHRPRGSEALGWYAYVALNLGLLLRAFGEPFAALRPNPMAGAVIVFAAMLQWSAALSFVGNTWSRVR